MAWRSDQPGPRRTTPRPERQFAFRFWLSAESRAATLLMAKGFRIMARRWRPSVGEVDIVARRK
jgi:putative endonuclease